MRKSVDTFSKAKGLIHAILTGMTGISKPVYKLISHLLPLWWSIAGRYNFTNLGRYGNYTEKSLRHSFERGFDWLQFNLGLLQSNDPDRYILGFDTTHIRKSGHKTPGIGYFWSGNEKRMQHGLEVGILSAIDCKKQTAFSLEAIQTPSNRHREKKINLVSHYTNIFLKQASTLLKISKYVAVDGYFMKRKFILPLLKSGFQVITKMRQDAYLQYLYTGKITRGGRKYAGKVDLKNIDSKYMNLFASKKGTEYFQGILYCKRLKMKVKIVYIRSSRTKEYEVLLCTDLQLDENKIVRYYSLRFQIEFLIRDAKQHAGLEHCQSRSLKKYAFHFNASFTSVSVAKSVFCTTIDHHHLSFSLQNLKRLYYNYLFIEKIFAHFGINLKSIKNGKKYEDCLRFGQIAA